MVGSALGDDIVANRNDYGRVIGLHGDSITRGFALGVFEDAVSPLDPLYNFRSIESMCNWALTLNGRTETVAFVDTFNPSRIADHIANGVYRDDDLIICQDAADPEETVTAYYRRWRDCRFNTVFAGLEFAGQTTPDYSTNALHQFDLKRGDPPQSYNDIIRAACTVDTDSATGTTQLIDMNALIDEWRALASFVDGVDVMLTGGIHVNVWGQLRMAGAVLEAAGLRQYVTDVDAIQDVAEANFADLDYGSATFTGARARLYVKHCIGA